jgi:hypothetical protein
VAYTSKREVLAVWCPFCGARVGETCVTEILNAKGEVVERRPWPQEWSQHQKRHALAIEQGAKPRQRRQRQAT